MENNPVTSVQPHPLNKWVYRVASFTLVLGFAAVFLITYWMVYPYKVLEFKEGNGTVLTKRVRAGEYVELRQINCKYMPLVSTLNRQFIDSILYQIPLVQANRPVGCSDKIENVPVPKTLPPGDYYINTVISFQVNPIRTVSYTVKTNMFTVIK